MASSPEYLCRRKRFRMAARSIKPSPSGTLGQKANCLGSPRSTPMSLICVARAQGASVLAATSGSSNMRRLLPVNGPALGARMPAATHDPHNFGAEGPRHAEVPQQIRRGCLVRPGTQALGMAPGPNSLQAHLVEGVAQTCETTLDEMGLERV